MLILMQVTKVNAKKSPFRSEHEPEQRQILMSCWCYLIQIGTIASSRQRFYVVLQFFSTFYYEPQSTATSPQC